MEPPAIQFVRTPDGFDIAYTDCGEGLPFVFMPWPFSHRGLMWSSNFGRPLLEGLASHFRLICYDSRGQGMSTRGLPEDHCIDDYLVDLETVMGRLNLERFILFGCPLFSHVAVKYAAAHPERVLALVLANSSIDSAWGDGSFEEFARRNWDAFIYTFASGFSVAQVPVETAYWRESLNREDFLRMSAAARTSSIRSLLPQLQMPVFVGTTRYLRDGATVWPFLLDAQIMATLIPHARLDISETDGEMLLPDESGVPGLIPRLVQFLRDVGLLDEDEPPKHTSAVLSAREIDILKLIARGQSNQEIAAELVLSVRTVERHITNLYAKIGARRKADATAYALRNGLA